VRDGLLDHGLQSYDQKADESINAQQLLRPGGLFLSRPVDNNIGVVKGKITTVLRQRAARAVKGARSALIGDA
jgi:hypothetical protein